MKHFLDAHTPFHAFAVYILPGRLDLALVLFEPAHIASFLGNLGEDPGVVTPQPVSLWCGTVEFSHVEIAHKNLQGPEYISCQDSQFHELRGLVRTILGIYIYIGTRSL